MIFFNKAICVSAVLHKYKCNLKMLFTIVLAYFSGYGESDKSFARVAFCDVGGFLGGAGSHVSNLLTFFLNRVRAAGSGLV